MSFQILGSQKSNASNGAQFGAEMKELQQLEAEHRKLLDSKETSISYLLRAFDGKSKVKDYLEWQVLGERYEPLQGASVRGI